MNNKLLKIFSLILAVFFVAGTLAACQKPADKAETKPAEEAKTEEKTEEKTENKEEEKTENK